MIHTFGGSFIPPDNLLNRSSLLYILHAVRFSSYGFDRYPTLFDKASGLACNIITRHVFYDGNKRTGTHIAWAFLKANGIDVYLDNSIIDLAVRVATSNADEVEVATWWYDHVTS
jgi:death-on-curing protein